MEYSYPIAIRKPRKLKKSKTKAQDTYRFLYPPEHCRQFYVGNLNLGVLSEKYTKCNNFESLSKNLDIVIQSKDEEDVFLVYDGDTIVCGISLMVDSPFIINLLKCRKFYFKLVFKESSDSEVVLNVYFKKLPLLNSAQAINRTVIQLFEILYNIGHDPVEMTKKIDDVDAVEQVFQSIQNHQFSLLNQKQPTTRPFEQSTFLKPKLRPYQQDAVKWMLAKEKAAFQSDVVTQMHPHYVEVNLPQLTIYFDQYLGDILLERPTVNVSLSGAILADEMGLGKTIEILAVILADYNDEADDNDTSDDDEPLIKKQRRMTKATSVKVHRQPKRPSYKVEVMTHTLENVGSLRERLNIVYEQTLRSVLTEKIRIKQEVACICGSFEKKNLEQCVDCVRKQHSNCVGYKKSMGIFRCSECWAKQPPIPSKATLIVCPLPLCQQWINEITKHVRNCLNVLCYDGCNILTPVYPTKLATYDIVITTYTVLQSEFYLVDQVQGKSLRNLKKYSPPGSPIMYVHWKRLCLDEAQLVENHNSMIANMAQRLHAHFRWAITGTPVSVSLSELYGLVEYLHLAPYDNKQIFANTLYNPYLNGHEKALIDFFGQFLWRTRKASVLDQIDIPPQAIKHHIVEFTQVEQYFYDCETKECRMLFAQKSAKLDNSTQLMAMTQSELKGLLQPVSALRRVCIHHNVVNGRYLLTKKPVNSMQELLDALIARNINDCEEHLRVIISAFNGLAGLYLLLKNPLTAAENYIKVMMLEEKYFKDNDVESLAKLGFDKLPLIHMYYNLRELVKKDNTLSCNLSTVFKKEIKLDVDELKTKQDYWEHEYLNKFEHQTKQVIQSLSELSQSFLDLEENIVEGNWYADLISAIFSAKLQRFMTLKMKIYLENMVNTKFLPTEAFIIEMLITWLNSLSTMREEALSSVNDLYEITHDGQHILLTPSLIQETVDCHLRPDKKQKKQDKIECRFCKSNTLFQQYEKVLYYSVVTSTGKQLNWHHTIEEHILTACVNIASNKLKHLQNLVAIGKTFLEMLETQKKEFIEMRKTWTYLEAQVCAYDELKMCKIRLQLKQEGGTEKEKSSGRNMALKQLSYNIVNHLETINELAEHEIDTCRFNLEHEQRSNTLLLEKCLGTNKYLMSLQHREGGEQMLDPCPICRCPLEKSWNMMQCGHAYCIPCMETIVGRSKVHPDQKITCAICRQVQKLSEINCIDESHVKKDSATLEGGDSDDIVVVGNCSSKVGRIVKLIKQLKLENPKVKVLVFSSFQPVLNILRDIFEQNQIASVTLVSGKQVVKTVETFKDPSKGVTVLLLPVNLGAKGLNLIEATHVIFAEPILDPAEEQQAIGRVHRIGQKKGTVVHKFIMKDSIEANIQRVTSSKDKAKWTRAQITVQQLKDLLFGTLETDENVGVGEVEDEN